MSADTSRSGAPVIPVLRYRDADAAAKFLDEIFGFAPRSLYRDEAGRIVHGELHFGASTVMIGPVSDTPFGRLMRQPADAGGVTTTIYVVVDDPDAHHRRSVEAGFEIVMPLRDESYGGREYSVRDPEGHVWTFGTYDPARSSG